MTQSVAPQEALLQQYDEADVELPASGQWQAGIDVLSALGVGSTSFELTVLPARQVNWLLLMWGIGALLIGLGLYGRRRAR